MDLKELQESWNELATKDAFDAVLTRSGGVSSKWDPDVFFRTGIDEVEAILRRVQSLYPELQFGRALDFGCGVGRLTQPLSARFGRVDGVDISPAMIERARQVNRHGERCHYHLNETPDLKLFPSCTFDFVYSNITLQHIEPQYSRRYIEEFFRILHAGGVAVFQLPSAPLSNTRPRTRSSIELARRACRAAIDAGTAVECAPGARLPLQAVVRNLGTATWPAESEHDGPYSIRLGNHWRKRFGRVLRFDDRRSGLPHDVEPGESVVIGLPVDAPSEPGTYTLELDMVQEDVRWFAEAGSRPARIRVRVDDRFRPGHVRGLPRHMEMHGIPRPEVESLIAERGALLAVDPDDAPGPTWTSFRYFARR
jgi:SAM-dependent methyltransferase